MLVARSVTLFVIAAIAEIGGAWLVWQGVREHRGWPPDGRRRAGARCRRIRRHPQPDAHFGRVLAAYGGIFVAGSLLWGVLIDGFRPEGWDLIGAAVCLIGVAVIMDVPRDRTIPHQEDTADPQ